MPELRLRILLDPGGHIGPGKVQLLEGIGQLGSIAAAGRAMGMSYRRAWELVEEMNRIFGQPVAAAQIGGRQGGGAQLTPLGEEIVRAFRQAEAAAAVAIAPQMRALQAAVRTGETRGQDET
ncbi:winged helix-turn-helix domain-containing protein [Acidisoma sp. C75]